MRKALEEQINDNRQKLNLEKHINNEQARIWKIDVENYKNMEQQNEEKV